MLNNLMHKYDGTDASFQVILMLLVMMILGFLFRTWLERSSQLVPNIETNDLKIVEGIGPKIEELLKGRGIDTWEALAKADAGQLLRMMDDAGPNFRNHNPATWPKQASMAASGLWTELNSYQKHLIGGNEPTFIPDEGPQETHSKLEEKAGFNNFSKDDLKIVEGIGPKIELLLHNAGIQTWKALAETKPDTLKQVLTEAGSRFQMHNPTTWPEQAALADQGDWDKLQEYQDLLIGGHT